MEYQGCVEKMGFSPVKSCGIMGVTAAYLTPAGLIYKGIPDHQYMVVDANPRDGVYSFISQRLSKGGIPKMALVKPVFDGDDLYLTWDGQDLIELDLEKNRGSELLVKIHDDTTYGVDQGDKYGIWLADHLGRPLRLVKASGSFYRRAGQYGGPNDCPISFQDGYPINWFDVSSLDEISQRMGEDVSWKVFRPQIVTKGFPAQYEHLVLRGIFNRVPFVNDKPCGRCEMTNIDPETGEIVRNTLRALGGYKVWRNKDNGQKFIFAENALIRGEGWIAVGDPLIVEELRSEPPAFYGLPRK